MGCKLQLLGNDGKGINWSVNCKRRQKDLTGGSGGQGPLTDFESTDDDVATIAVRLYAALTVPKYSSGQMVYQYCPRRVKKCHPHLMSLFGDQQVSPGGRGGRRSRVSSKHYRIHTRLLLEGMFHSNKIPKKMPKKCLWSSIKCKRNIAYRAVPFI